ncbi:unnamed protein product [marine sediment metagenome]|uniref:Uncharacterized protein n=1 Tax=marine sediment metagenome TaxID=412755 RepID=X0TQ73_9ZZZZ
MAAKKNKVVIPLYRGEAALSDRRIYINSDKVQLQEKKRHWRRWYSLDMMIFSKGQLRKIIEKLLALLPKQDRIQICDSVWMADVEEKTMS